jgi:hypothetical protein
MRSRPAVLRAVVVVLLLIGLGGGAFAAGRSTVARPGRTDPLRLDRGLPISVLDSRAGAVVAADNYVVTGITAGLDSEQLRQFAKAVIEPAARERFIGASQSLAQNSAPAGARALGSVVAHRLENYGSQSARVSVWALGSEWDGGLAPTQYSALVDLWLHWAGDRWRVAAVRESLPGPVPALIAGPGEARSAGAWDQVLSGMSAPYYGDR